MMTSSTSLLVLTLFTLCVEVRGHGRLLDPPSRASMWREGYNTPKNYDDNQLFCGGFHNQKSHGGKCGVCGDPWQGPRDHEAGGKYATGTITATYTQGQNVTITIQITANHKGWFEFRLCPVNNKNVKATHECLNQNILTMADGSGTRYPIGSDNKKYMVDVNLPSNLTCTQCVLQWRYHTGNSWGVDPDGRQCVGCGPQEEFYGCSDIAIIANEEQQTTSIPRTTSQGSTTLTTDHTDTTTEALTTSTFVPRTTTQGSTSLTTDHTDTTTEASVTSTTRKPTTTTSTSTTTDTPSHTSFDTCSSSAVTPDDIVSNTWCTNNCGSGVCKKVLICV